MRCKLYAKGTVRGMTYILRNFARWLDQNTGVTTLEYLQEEHLKRWNRHILKTVTPKGMPCKPRYIHRHLTCIRQWLHYLASENLLAPMLCNAVQLIRLPDHLPGSVLTHAQVRKMFSSISTTTQPGYTRRTVLEVLYTSGIRAAELMGLKLSDVNYENKTLLVTGKGNKQRVVPLGRTAMKYLETYVKAVRPFLVGNP